MRRREFIALLCGAAAWPFAVYAQQSATRPLIGVLSALSPTAAKRNIEGLREGLRALGCVEGRNVSLELRFAEGVVARLPELASDLVALKPDVILAGSLSSILAARNATTTIPLIFLIIEDPVALGLVSSITKPGGHITGVWLFGDDSLIAKRVEFLKHVVPGLARIGLIINPDDQTDAIYLKHLPATARALGVDLSVWSLLRPDATGCKRCLSAKVLCSLPIGHKLRRLRRAFDCQPYTASGNTLRRAA